MATTIQLKRAGTANDWLESEVILAPGEAGVALDTGEIRIGNGNDVWSDLPYVNSDDRFLTIAPNPFLPPYSWAGDPAINDDAKIAAYESQWSGYDVDLKGRTVRISAIPTGNRYFNGTWTYSSVQRPMVHQAVTTATGYGRVAFGEGALDYLVNTDRNYNPTGSLVALGRQAAEKLQESRSSIAIGTLALGNAIKSWDNIAIGTQALQNVQAANGDRDTSNQDGTRNIGIGGNALLFADTATGDVAVGRNAVQSKNGGRGAVGIGCNALSGYVQGGFDDALTNYLPWGSGDVYTVAVGLDAMNYTTGQNNVAVGGNALLNVKKSDHNTALGARALKALDTETGPWGGTRTARNWPCTYTQSGKTITITRDAHGLAVGDFVSINITSGDAQTITQMYGVKATVATVPTANTFTVASTVDHETSGSLTVVSTETSAQVSANGGNTALGSSALLNLATGFNNVAVGYAAGSGPTSGSQNVIVGHTAATSAGLISNSVLVGYRAASNVTALTNSVAIGLNSLRYNVNGSTNTSSWDNVVGLGSDARVTGSNQVQLGNSSQTVYAQSAVQTRSDARDKTDIEDTALGLDFIDRLRPVDFRWKRREDDGKIGTRKHHGVIAQEVREVIKETGVDFGGFQDHEINGGDEALSIGYEELIAPLIKAVQQLSARVVELEGK